ncbi:MAG: hypothetical protein HY785_18420 [Oscillatoriophycideae cyanobacterium NC_groundwater_1537_Pr4_S-0.65um_50_18]|nr:hypothetical protein [Oscillatoriophycideae cyanobacterium NC_groundwater_1537_Pr4_S-0.65um_50_18]
MATENPKIVAYIPEQVYEQVLSLRDQWQLKSTSQVVSVILQDYFGIDPFPPYSDLREATVTQRMTAVEENVKSISTGLAEANELINHLKLEIQTLQRSATFEAQELNENTYSRKRILRIPQITPLVPHRSAELAQRLGVSKSTISVYKIREDFTEWTKTKDPQGIAWIYNSMTKQFNFLVSKET